MGRFVLGLLWILAVSPSSRAATEEVTLAAPFPVVGYVERRGKIITLKAGPAGTLYSIETKDGKVLAENLDEKELLAKDPALHALVRNALAAGEGFIDASLGHKPGG